MIDVRDILDTKGNIQYSGEILWLISSDHCLEYCGQYSVQWGVTMIDPRKYLEHCGKYSVQWGVTVIDVARYLESCGQYSVQWGDSPLLMLWGLEYSGRYHGWCQEVPWVLWVIFSQVGRYHDWCCEICWVHWAIFTSREIPWLMPGGILSTEWRYHDCCWGYLGYSGGCSMQFFSYHEYSREYALTVLGFWPHCTKRPLLYCTPSTVTCVFYARWMYFFKLFVIWKIWVALVWFLLTWIMTEQSK